MEKKKLGSNKTLIDMAWINSAFDELGPLTFKKPATTRKRGRCVWSGSSRKAEDGMWVETRRPQKKDDLAVHKRKVQEVETWLDAACKKKGASIAVFSGTAGCGKTATLLTLARDRSVEVLEWINPSSETKYDVTDNDVFPQSQISMFTEFLFRGSRYGCIDLLQSKQKLILVEDLPNACLRNVNEFHTLLRRYCQTGRCPLVFIVTDSQSKENNIRRLFPQQILGELNITTISFNPVAPTSVVKVLERISSSEELTIDKATLQSLSASSGGDLRSAINALQFICSKDVQKNKEVFPSKKFKPTSKPKKTDTSKKACAGEKDISLFLFHGLGKILHCKRKKEGEIPPHEKLPLHLSKFERHPLDCNPEEIPDRTQCTVDTFNLFLHQNYLDFYTHIEDVEKAVSYLSDADYFLGEWTSKQALEDCASSVAMRGLLHSNTCVKGGWKPITKPQWFDGQKKMTERMTKIKDAFHEPWWTMQELTTQYIPYLSRLGRSYGNSSQHALVASISQFPTSRSSSRHHSNQLSELDVQDDDCNDSQLWSVPTNLSTSAAVTDVVDNEEDEEFVIEESDD